jgi:hypothetical protein
MRDLKETAIDAGKYLKQKQPQSEVSVPESPGQLYHGDRRGKHCGDGRGGCEEALKCERCLPYSDDDPPRSICEFAYRIIVSVLCALADRNDR